MIITALLSLIALLLIPVNLSFNAGWHRQFTGEVLVRWLFGLVRLQLRTDSKGSDNKSRKTKAQSKRKKHQRAKSTHLTRRIVRAARLPVFRQRTALFVHDFWRALHPKNTSLRLRVGLGDPAETGQLWAVVGPAVAMLSTIRQVSVDVQPEFFESTFEADTHGSTSFIPLQLIALFIALMLSPSIWKALKDA